MNITQAVPSKIPTVQRYRLRFDWSPLMKALAAAEVGTWLSVSLTDLPQIPVAKLQTALHGVVHARDIRIRTRVEDESLFVLLTEKPK